MRVKEAAKKIKDGHIVNVYDFDGTIYDGDCTVDFALFCVRRRPLILRRLPGILGYALLFGAGRLDKTAFKERMFTFLKDVDAEEMAARFWETHIQKIKSWYLKTMTPEDVVVSASPEFLLRPACRMLMIREPIGSRVSPSDGRYDGVNCHGEEKVRRFFSKYPGAVIDAFFSDSAVDLPLAKVAKKRFFVKGDKVSAWEIN